MEQQTHQQVPPATPPKNWLVESILVTVLCCLVGIVGIVFASQVNSKWAIGDYAGAHQASKNAKTWTLIALGGAVLLWIILFAFYGTLIMMALRGERVD